MVYSAAIFNRVAGAVMAARKGFGALVFGGGSGLGLATGKRLVKNGYKVVLADLPSSDGDRVARDLGDSCIFAPADVSGTGLGHIFAAPPLPSNPPLPLRLVKMMRFSDGVAVRAILIFGIFSRGKRKKSIFGMEGVPIWFNRPLKKFNNYSFAFNNCTLL